MENLDGKIKCITFDKKAQDSPPDSVKEKMKADKESARESIERNPNDYRICRRTYESSGIRFNAGCIERQEGISYPLEYWRRPTTDELKDFYNTPEHRRPKGRYYSFER
ncbi:MAG: hypothetical protein LBQ73_07130 [Tannerellaceae bacterium]|jgi:hypothetical protein|nr:hypothetical protein [Tannerellaceae bacterium]